ncbi:hypothetical protein CHUAL_000575 [Chamberlinius hualienensis]
MSRFDVKEPDSPVLVNDYSSYFKTGEFSSSISSKTFPQNTLTPCEPRNLPSSVSDDPRRLQSIFSKESQTFDKNWISRTLASRSAAKRSSKIDYSSLRVLKTNEELAALANVESKNNAESNAANSRELEECSTCKDSTYSLLNRNSQFVHHSAAKQNSTTSVSDENREPAAVIAKLADVLPTNGSVPSTSTARNDQGGAESSKLVVPKATNDVEIKSANSDVVYINGQSYRIMRVIGVGGSSKVYEAYDSERKLKAIKSIDLSQADDHSRESYVNEINVLKRLQHSDRIIKLFEYEYNPVKKLLLVTLERGDTDFASFLKSRSTQNRITSEMIKFYWSEMLRAVEVIHSAGIIHSDLKPANFLIVKGHLKLIDFGISSFIPSDATSIIRETMVGSISYISPEAITDTRSSDRDAKEHPKIKIGVKSDDAMKMLLAIVNPGYQIDYPPVHDKLLLEVMQRCIVHQPQQRASIKELLEHPYLTGESEKNLDSFLTQLMVKLSPTSTNKVQKVGPQFMFRVK